MKGRRNLVPMAARTASGQTAAIPGFKDVDELRVQVDCDAVSGTNPSVTVYVEDSVDGGASWNLVDTFTAITAAGQAARNITSLFADTLRIRWAITGTTPSLTFGVDVYAE